MEATDDRSPEARVPTTLIDRRRGREGVPTLEHGAPTLFVVGPYEVTRGVVRAPGAWLVEARGTSGEAVLLQLAHLKSVATESELLVRQELERRVARETAALCAESQLPIMAHGGADRDDLSRVLFWALPWRAQAERLQSAPIYIEGASHLLMVAMALAQRLARQHVLNRLDPLLSEYLVAVTSDGAEVVGVPANLPAEWLASDMPPPRLAPEEAATGKVTKQGDVWRLGQTLVALACAFESAPEPLVRMLERMTQADPASRPPRATEVVVELEAIRSSFERGLALVPNEGSRTVRFETMSPDALSELVVATLGDSTRTEGAVPPHTDELRIVPGQPLDPADIEDTERAFIDFSHTTLDGVPPWAFFFSPTQLEGFLGLVREDLDGRGVRHRVGEGIVQLHTPDGGAFRYLGLTDLARTCHAGSRADWPRQIRDDFDALFGVHPNAVEGATSGAADTMLDLRWAEGAPDLPPISDPSATIPDAAPSEATIDDSAAVLPIILGRPSSTRILPSSPVPLSPPEEAPTEKPSVIMRGVVSGRESDASLERGANMPAGGRDAMVLERGRAEQNRLERVAGVPAAGRDAVAGEQGRTEQGRWERGANIAAPGRDAGGVNDTISMLGSGMTVREMDSGSWDGVAPPPDHLQPLPPPARAPSEVSAPSGMRSTVILASLGVLAVLGLGAFAARFGPEMLISREATPAQEVVLDARPRGAVVVAERDGRVLGRTPLKLLVPSESEVAVLIASEGREPQRILLPERGAISTTLAPLPTDLPPCAIAVDASVRASYEAVEAQVGSKDALVVPGAAVIRREGQGAWLVRCPQLGGHGRVSLERAPLGPVRFRVSGPLGAPVRIDGRDRGPAPMEVVITGAMTEVAVEVNGQWITRWVPSDVGVEVEMPTKNGSERFE